MSGDPKPRRAKTIENPEHIDLRDAYLNTHAAAVMLRKRVACARPKSMMALVGESIAAELEQVASRLEGLRDITPRRLPAP